MALRDESGKVLKRSGGIYDARFMTHVPYQITHELRDIRSHMHVLNQVKRRIRAKRGSVTERRPEVTFLHSWVVVLPRV